MCALLLETAACTEILAGANIAMDLVDPGKNIPEGTLVAILLSSFIYLIMGIVAAGAVSPEGLLHNYLCMVDIAASPVLVYIGIYAATFSSALSVQFCAPRVLMSVANDNVLPILKIFGKTNSKGDPVASALLCFGISLIFVLIGDLNIVAPLITQVLCLLFVLSSCGPCCVNRLNIEIGKRKKMICVCFFF
ncbi:putative Na-K-Cl cotransporter [Reticulomyxa filosa]|uniref:Putative Na-K-Cl cotransporter n=1 Tax=Reticulomyxa filosa TaxID=46433 RepID=X6NEL7_RETFI|nr:putative Na-K-Cl cotransporter [Reticulomyxa filosa]|eukprot:ETO24775.1 putative Na-K-Cl cotransporter [Reticulomyxa filosa]